MAYFFDKKLKCFYKTPEQSTILTTDAIEITKDEYQTNKQTLPHLLSYKSGKLISLVEEDLLTDEQKSEALKIQALNILNNSEVNFRWTNKIKFDRYSAIEQKKIIKYYDDLVAVVNAESDKLPELKLGSNKK